MLYFQVNTQHLCLILDFFRFVLAQNDDVGVLVEVSPPSSHGVGSEVKVPAKGCLDIELDVDVVHPRDVPLGPRPVLPLYLVGGDPSIQIELVDISTEPGIPTAFT